MKPSFALLIVAGSLVGFAIVASVKHFGSNNSDPVNPESPAPKSKRTESKPVKETVVGDILHTFNGVNVYENGNDYSISHGKHSAKDGYYYGHLWQCVEFVKRYYHDAHQHHMPEVMGHAIHFFDTTIKHGELNKARGMIQFKNQGSEKPKKYDLLVWGSNRSSYGHVAVITNVHDDYVEVVQQNCKGKPTERLSLAEFKGHYLISEANPPLGWLRLPNLSQSQK